MTKIDDIALATVFGGAAAKKTTAAKPAAKTTTTAAKSTSTAAPAAAHASDALTFGTDAVSGCFGSLGSGIKLTNGSLPSPAALGISCGVGALESILKGVGSMFGAG